MASKHVLTASAMALFGAVLGCGGAPSAPQDPVEALLAAPSATPSAEPAAAPAASKKKGGDDGGDLNEDQEKQMEIALRRGGEKAANCANVVQGAPGGSGEVRVLFDGQKGRVTDVTVGPPWVGTPVEPCIKRAFVGEIVMPFDGEPREVPYTIKVGAKADDVDADKGKDAKGKDAKGKDAKGKDAKGKDAKGKPSDKKDKKK
jgi:hypothetical protein